VQKVQETPFGRFVTVQTCYHCHGRGEVIKDLCPECRGRGRVKQTKKVKIKIEAGIEEGTRLRVAGEGEAGERGGPPGDLYIVVHVKPHPQFKRRGDDVISEIKVSIPQAVLGTSVEVPTLDGEVQVTIPPGTQHGTYLRLKGRGIPHFRSFGRGDHRLLVKIDIPKELSAREKELLTEWAELRGDAVNKPEGKGFLGKMKDAFNF
jgi:molecular chaperone DnaJ